MHKVAIRIASCLIGVLLSANLAPTSPARAENTASPEAVQAATELAAIISKDLLAQVLSQMTAQIWPQIAAKARGNADAATMADLRGEFEHAMLDFVTQSLKDMPGIYARYFTVDELHDIAAFYRTSTGQKALQLMPRITGETYGLMLPRLAGMQQQLEQVTVRVMREHGYAKTPE